MVIIGADKTAVDACVWLLEQGVPTSSIRWVKPRGAWWINRKFQQGHTLAPDFLRGVAIQLEAMAQASSVDDLFLRLEAEGVFLRVDTQVLPTMFRGAVLSEAELALLRQIDDVVRLGHVKRIEPHEIVLDEGRVPTSPETLHVHCAARGLARPPLRPIFEPGRVTVQPIMWGFACYQAATLGVMEATIESDEEKNLCTPIPYWDANADFASAFLATMFGDQLRGSHERVRGWAKATRLNPVSAIAPYRDDPRVAEARERIKRFGLPAAANLQKILAPASS